MICKLYKSNHFGLSFDNDAPKIWNDLPDDVQSATISERTSKPISLHKHIHPNLCFSWFLSVALTPAMSQVNDYQFSAFSL